MLAFVADVAREAGSRTTPFRSTSGPLPARPFSTFTGTSSGAGTSTARDLPDDGTEVTEL